VLKLSRCIKVSYLSFAKKKVAYLKMTDLSIRAMMSLELTYSYISNLPVKAFHAAPTWLISTDKRKITALTIPFFWENSCGKKKSSLFKEDATDMEPLASMHASIRFWLVGSLKQ
jgi:hypothetical protein